ncbi:MAG: patatin-like phospholipase family protein [Rubrivivax sp.]|nr:patatin-like phospholipase family protein [Rubrivivax sp.]
MSPPQSSLASRACKAPESGSAWRPVTRSRALWIGGLVLQALLLSGCATRFDNEPQNQPITADFVASSSQLRGIVGAETIGLSLSGGGLRAAAFSFGVMQALMAAGEPKVDLFDDLTFMSSVSGGSLTAAYIALHGRDGMKHFRARVLDVNLERDLRLSLFSPSNLARLLAGGVNDRSNLAATLDADIFRGATFADLYRRNKPDVWINATDLYNRTPFPFIPPVFIGLCSDLSRLRVSEAVAASMAVPLAFAPVVLKTFPGDCLNPLPPNMDTMLADDGGVTAGILASTARAIRNYRDPERMRYVKLADGGLTDNQGLASILIARAVSDTSYGPLREDDVVRLRRMLFLIVDAGRPPAGDWALRRDGPSGVDVGVASADAAIDSATRLSAAAFRTMTSQWRENIIRHRCSLSDAQVRRHVPAGQAWRCDDVTFFVGTVSAESLGPERAARMRDMPTRLSLPRADVDAAINAGRDAALANPALRAYLADRAARP